MNKHYIADESIGGIEREYVEVDAQFYWDKTDIVRIDGERYRLIDRHAEVGEKILDLYFDEGVFIREVVEPEYASEKIWYTFETEHGEDTAPIGSDEYRVLEPVELDEADPLTVDETQASPEVVELLANLARRVTQLEQQLRDTQRNVETFAQQTETNSEGIRLLDERTTCDCTSKSGAELLAEAFGALTRYEKRGDR